MPDYAGNSLIAAREISFAAGLQTFSDRVDTFDTDDYYRISIGGRSSLNLTINGLSANANLQLLDRNGNTLQSSTNSAGIAESINQVLDADTYYIRVYQSSSGADTDYTFNLKLQNSPKTDIFWRDYNSGANTLWFMGGTDNTSKLASAALTAVPTNWQVEGIADFNGDNHPDLLWRDYSSGANTVWFMGGTDNTSKLASAALSTVPTNWHIEGIADFNGDNHPDLLWRDYGSGANTVWFMGGTDNTSKLASAALSAVPTNWHIEGIADFNGDKRPDLLWRDYSSGANTVWFMGGTDNTSKLASAALASVPINWQALPYNRYEEPLPIDLAGNTTSAAFNLGTLSGSGTFSDRIDSADLYDYYQLTISNTSNINLLLNGLSANANIQLLNSSGTVIQGSYNSGTSAESISAALGAGTYYVLVYQVSGTTNYSLNLSATATSTNLYYFTYYYGNGDSYQGYGYTTDSSYYSGKYFYDTSVNETGNKGYYYISNLYSGYSTSYNNQVYVYSYYNSENSTSYTPYSGSGSSGLGSEYGYLTSAQTFANDYFGGKYYEADVPSANLYYFTYYYGNGDYYQGYGYTTDSSYYSGKSLSDSSANETGNKGYYYISNLYGGYSTSYNNQVYVYSYYNSENSTSYTPYSGSGSSGLGSEYGYLTSGDSNTYYGGKYYEADLGYQYYTFKYSYGSGQDYYTGYGYADYGKYTSSQSLNDSSANETGNYGFYQITGITNYASGTASLNKVYVSSYYNSENSTSYTPYSGSGSNGLGSEYGYLTSTQTTSNDYFGGRYYEADVPVYKYSFTYYYNGSNTSADYYTGYVYASPGTYTVGSYFDYTSSNNQAGYNGKYYINNFSIAGSSSDVGKVYVTTYYDIDSSGNSYSAYYANLAGYASAYNGLGTEGDYIYDGSTYRGFGYDRDEVDAPRGSITVTSPNGGNVLRPGSSQTITWNDNLSENVKLDLYKGGAFYSTIATSVTSNGSYTWTLPTSLSNGSDYSIRISSVNNSSIYDSSDTTFSVKADLKKFWFYYNFNPQTYTQADSYVGSVIAPDWMYALNGTYDPSAATTEAGLNGQYLVYQVDDYNDDLNSEAGRVFVHDYIDRDNGSEKHFTPYKYSQGVQPSGTNYLGSELDYIDASQSLASKFGQDYYEADVVGGWFSQHVKDYGLQVKGDSLFADSKIDRNDTIALFRDAEDGGIIDSIELTDLRTVVSNYVILKMDDYVHLLADKVVNAYAANTSYTGGGTSTALGNLYAGSSANQMEQLISKWFLGLDRPTTTSTSYQYTYASGSLFQNGISYQDVFQGVVGDCYFLAGLAGTAFRSSSTIQSMFIDNGDNTYTVRFYNNGVADYVTVDRYLPTDTYGRFVYAHQSASSWGYYNDVSNELWVALAEKAYVQMNESGWLDGPASGQHTNSYQSIKSGYGGGAITDITGRNTTYDSLDASDFSAIGDAFNQSRWVYFSSKGTGQVASNVVSNHGYVLVGYNTSTQRFKLFNPWGIYGGYESGDSNPKDGYLDLTISELVSSFSEWTKTTT